MRDDNTLYQSPAKKTTLRNKIADDVEKFLSNGGEIKQVAMGEVSLPQRLTPSQLNARSFTQAMDKKHGRNNQVISGTNRERDE